MQPLVIRIENTETHQSSVHAFSRSPVHVGRTELNDLPLREPFVSHWHGIVRFDEQSIKYVDLGSTNGTTLGGTRLRKNEPVTVDERADLRIGPIRLHFSRDPVLAAEAEKQPKSRFAESAATQEEEPRAATRVLVSPFKPRKPAAEPAPPRAATPSPAASKGAPPPRSGGEDHGATVIVESPWMDRTAPGTFELPRPHGGSELPSVVVDHTIPGAHQLPRPALSPPRTGEPLSARASAFQRSARELLAGLVDKIDGLPEPQRPAALAELRKQILTSDHEAELRDLLSLLGVSVGDGGGPEAGDGVAAKLLSRFARSYVAHIPEFTSATEGERLLERVADVLETCAKAFVELRKGHDQFGEQMGIRTVSEETPLHRARDAREVLEYLLDWNAGERRVEELMRGFTDIMIHEIALMNGIRQGVRGLLNRVSPEAIDRHVGSKPWPLRDSARWKRYVDRFTDLVEEEEELMSAVFGREFARAYAAIMGEGSAKDRDDEDDDDRRDDDDDRRDDDDDRRDDD